MDRPYRSYYGQMSNVPNGDMFSMLLCTFHGPFRLLLMVSDIVKDEMQQSYVGNGNTRACYKSWRKLVHVYFRLHRTLASSAWYIRTLDRQHFHLPIMFNHCIFAFAFLVALLCAEPVIEQRGKYTVHKTDMPGKPHQSLKHILCSKHAIVFIAHKFCETTNC